MLSRSFGGGSALIFEMGNYFVRGFGSDEGLELFG